MTAHKSTRSRPSRTAPSITTRSLLKPGTRRNVGLGLRLLEVRIAAGTDYTRFAADEFDADIVYGAPPPEFYSGAQGLQGMDIVPLGTEVVTPLCSPELAPAIRSPRDLFTQTLIESDNKKVRWTDWFATNDIVAPGLRGPRFDRSFLSISAALDELGVALESTRLAERELASGRLVRPLQGVCTDVVYTGHWLVFPRTKRYSQSLVLFTKWLSAELGLQIDFSALDIGIHQIGPAQTNLFKNQQAQASRQFRSSSGDSAPRKS